MKNRTLVKDIYRSPETFGGAEVTVAGWARTIRDSKAFGFIELNDGSYFKNVQVVFERANLPEYDEIAKQNVGCSLIVKGKVVLTPEAKQPFEIKAGKIEYRLDKANIIHVPIGKASFSEEQLADNFQTLIDAVNKAKPATLKGQYMKSVSVAPTMGPGVKINPLKLV